MEHEGVNHKKQHMQEYQPYSLPASNLIKSIEWNKTTNPEPAPSNMPRRKSIA
jgi:hypothetical protein